MTNVMTRRGFVGMAAAVAVMGSARVAEAHDEATPGATPHAMAGGGTGAAYFAVTNTGEADDRLVMVASDVASAVEIHEMKEVNGVMEMAPLPDGLVIPAGQTVELEPGGLHIMLIGLTRNLKAGESFELALTFAQAGEITLQAPIFVSEAAAEDVENEPVTLGDLSIEGVWSRHAPALLGAGTTPVTSVE